MTEKSPETTKAIRVSSKHHRLLKIIAAQRGKTIVRLEAEINQAFFDSAPELAEIPQILHQKPSEIVQTVHEKPVETAHAKQDDLLQTQQVTLDPNLPF